MSHNCEPFCNLGVCKSPPRCKPADQCTADDVVELRNEIETVKRDPRHGGARPGAGRPITTGSSSTSPVWYRVSASERERIEAACAPGESVNAAAKRLAMMALAVYG